MSDTIPNYGGIIPKDLKQQKFKFNEALGIESLFRMVVLGPTGAGKSNLCMHIIKESPHIYSHLHLIARNVKQELYDYLQEKLQGFITIHDPDAPPSIDAIKKLNGLQLVIIDDFSNDRLLQKQLFSHYFTRSRHYKLSVIFIAHSYFSVDKIIRLNAEYCCILKANSKRDLKLVLQDYNLPGIDETGIYRAYKEATASKGQMLFVNSLTGVLRQNFKGKIFNEGQKNEEDNE